MKIGIFTKTIHVEKLVNFLNTLNIDYFISTSKPEVQAFDFDVGVSYCFPYIVDINYPVSDMRLWYNFHPAPLPKYHGLNNYSWAIKDKIKSFGVTLHIMTDEVDKGEVLKIKTFDLSSIPINSNELGCITHYYLFQLFKETIIALTKAPKNKKEFDKVIRSSIEEVAYEREEDTKGVYL